MVQHHELLQLPGLVRGDFQMQDVGFQLLHVSNRVARGIVPKLIRYFAFLVVMCN